MKNKLSTWDKLIMFKQWVKGLDGYGLIEHCHYCDSLQVKRVSSETIDDEYHATYLCMKCGSSADVTEHWEITQK